MGNKPSCPKCETCPEQIECEECPEQIECEECPEQIECDTKDKTFNDAYFECLKEKVPPIVKTQLNLDMDMSQFKTGVEGTLQYHESEINSQLSQASKNDINRACLGQAAIKTAKAAKGIQESFGQFNRSKLIDFLILLLLAYVAFKIIKRR